MKVWILRRLTWLALRGKLYYVWSKIYQFLFERKYRSTPVPGFVSLSGVSEFVGKMRWRKDTWVMLFDAISAPQATVARHLADQKAGDCDDISLVDAVCINDMLERGYLKCDTGIIDVGLLSVPWVDVKGKTGGHNVCAFSYKVPVSGSYAINWAHVSNWHGGEVITSAGGKALGSLEDVVKAVLGGKTSLGWSYADVNLKLLRYGRGEDLC